MLQALSDAEYKFISIEVRERGNQSDGGTFASSTLFEHLEENRFNMPPDTELPHSNIKAPVVIICDEGYPLKPYLLRPYVRKTCGPSENNFNYRLCRARRVVECAFRILNSKWRILGKDIETSVINAIDICLLYTSSKLMKK